MNHLFDFAFLTTLAERRRLRAGDVALFVDGVFSQVIEDASPVRIVATLGYPPERAVLCPRFSDPDNSCTRDVSLLEVVNAVMVSGRGSVFPGFDAPEIPTPPLPPRDERVLWQIDDSNRRLGIKNPVFPF
ncbi:MAG: hypothetical protein K9G59_18945 [Caulobacter sp.]|nr:hypothetical protein [Caulobacter sp.]